MLTKEMSRCPENVEFDEARVDEESAGILVFFRFEGECWIANRIW